MGNAVTPRPLSAASSYSSLGANAFAPVGLAAPPIMPGSALRLLNQGRAQGLFTPSTSNLNPSRPPGYASPGPYYTGYAPSPFGSLSAVSPTPPPSQLQQSTSQLKRSRSDADGDFLMGNSQQPPALAASPDIQMVDRSRPPSATPQDMEGPSPNKRARVESSSLHMQMPQSGSPSGSTSQIQVGFSSHAVNDKSDPLN